MKQPLLIIAFLFLSVLHLCAQNNKTTSISGSIIDSADHKPIPFVTIAVKNAKTNASVKAVLTDNNGTFSLNIPLAADKSYTLTASYIGYSSRSITITADKPAIDLGGISLSGNTNQLKSVNVTAQKPLVKQEIDRLTYDVQADPQSKAQTAMDMLRKVPLVTVDGNDNIQLQGSSAFKIFVNGKPSGIMDSNPTDVLKSMPADVIVRIEIITTPPAKYDSEGLAGIINIVTEKKAKNDGYNGTAGIRNSFPYGPNASVSATGKEGKFGASGFIGGGISPYVPSNQNNFRQTFGASPTILSQQGIGASSGTGVNASLQLTYEADSLHLITGAADYFRGDNSRYYDAATVSYVPNGTILQSYNLVQRGGNDYRGGDASLNYEIGFQHRPGRLLTFSYRYAYNDAGVRAGITALNRFNYGVPDNFQDNSAASNEHTLQVDYTHPHKNLTIDAGAKAILRNSLSNSDGQSFSTAAQGFVNDPSLINNFNYEQDVYGLYNSYLLKLTKWTFQGGVRAEHTHVNADFQSTGTTLNMDYTDVVPTLSAQLKLSKDKSLTLGITNRLQRPGIGILNPYVDRSNPQIISTGNPFLTPVISHLFELSYTHVSHGSLNLRLSYLYTNNSIIPVTKVIADTITENSYANVGQNKILRTAVSGNYQLTDKWGLNFNTGIFYVWITGTYNGQFFSNRGPRTNTALNTTYKLDNTWLLAFSGGYNRRYVVLQGGSNDYWYSTISATKTIKKFVLTALVNNPFATHYAFTNYTRTPDFYQLNTNYLIYRTANIGVSYKFGKLNSDIKKNKKSINNDDTPATQN